MDRVVKRGEKGIVIIAPMSIRPKEGKPAQQEGQEQSDRSCQPSENTTSR